MKETWDKAIAFVLSQEGGYVNDPKDPGGETNFGISKRSYPNLDIANLTIDDAKNIYQRDYWNTMGCNELSYPLDMIVFDTAVNMGIGGATNFLTQTNNWTVFLMLRIEKYSNIAKKTPQYLRGWLNRVILLWKAVR